MKNHKWSPEDYALLEENVRQFGRAAGCKATAEQLYVTEKACLSMYYWRLRQLTKHGIPVKNTEAVEEAKEELRRSQTERPKNTKRVKWTDIEISILKTNLEKYRLVNALKKTAKMTGRTYDACRSKAGNLGLKGLKRYHRMSESEEKELVKFMKKRISENPNNLQEVFREASEKFKCNKDSVARRWYGYGGDKYRQSECCRHNIGPLYSVVGSNSTINGKNQDYTDVKKTKWVLTALVNWIKGKKKKK